MTNPHWHRALSLATKSVAVIGGGPAGLMAAEKLVQEGFAVTVYEQKPSIGRKFLMAGRGGLNITHSEAIEKFLPRYGAAEKFMTPMIKDFTPQALCGWVEALGQEIFVGTSGRVFPKAFKASPLLRSWLSRLESAGVRFQLNHAWRGWDNDGNLIFQTETGDVAIKADATLLALGGASWPRLGSDAAWVRTLQEKNILITPLKPANCGFHVDWSDVFRKKHSGQPVKTLAMSFAKQSVRGEIMITETGIEGGPVYALSSALRSAIEEKGKAEVFLDLRPEMSLQQVERALQRPRGALSFSNYLRKALSLSSSAIGLLMEQADRLAMSHYTPEVLAARIKSLPLTLVAPSGIDRAISTAGGISLSEVSPELMLKKMTGVFVAGEMLDWEAPTGGYLLQGCFATGICAARGICNFMN